MARVTLATIAKETGLSKFAVSRSLSGKDGVSEATRLRVQEVAARLGYPRPTPATAVPVIGVVFHDMDLINSELHLLIQGGVQAEAQRRGYQVRMTWTHVPEEIEEFERGCDALVMVGPHDKLSYSRVYGVAKPAVRTGWVDPLEPVDWVGGTDHEAGSAVANYLLGLGHRAIAFVHGTPGYRGRAERFYGLREVLEKRDDVEFREMKFATEVSFTDALLQLHADGFRPTAFFCAHDGLGVTAISELLRLGYRIPEDVSVVGFGDYSSATQITPRLTTVCGFGQHIGAACVRLLDDRIHNRLAPGYPLRTMVTGRIIERDSSRPVHQPVEEPVVVQAGAGGPPPPAPLRVTRRRSPRPLP